MIEIIAEIGWNHCGNMELAKEMIIAASKSGATFAKFQTWSEKRLVSGVWDNDGRREIYKKAELDEKKHYELIKCCNENNIEFLSSVFSIPDAQLLKSVGVNKVKIPSFESRNVELIKFCDENFDQIFMSIGTSTYDEAVSSINNIKSAKVSVMHCVSIYPGLYEKANMPKLIKIITEFPKFSKLVNSVGYSDHIIGIDSAKAAICLGAKVIEKHFTIDNNLPGRDNLFSILPNEVRDLREFADNFEKMMISHGDNFQPEEFETRNNYAGRFNN
jgi:sialic acid synthase SpsE